MISAIAFTALVGWIERNVAPWQKDIAGIAGAPSKNNRLYLLY